MRLFRAAHALTDRREAVLAIRTLQVVLALDADPCVFHASRLREIGAAAAGGVGRAVGGQRIGRRIHGHHTVGKAAIHGRSAVFAGIDESGPAVVLRWLGVFALSGVRTTVPWLGFDLVRSWNRVAAYASDDRQQKPSP
jgi:hypothetical protein